VLDSPHSETVILGGSCPAGAPQRKNGPVHLICEQCGSISIDAREVCSFCSAPIGKARDAQEDAALVSPSVPEWRAEVAQRLADYRRRRGKPANDSQTRLPFAPSASGQAAAGRPRHSRAPAVEEEAPLPRAAPRLRPKPRVERMEIPVNQPAFDFSHAEQNRTGALPHRAASMGSRRMAAVLDVLFLGMAYAAFLALFHSLGGLLGLSKLAAGVYGTSFFLLYASYFTFFTVLSGATPGLQMMHITAVGMDGDPAGTSQLVWRSFGYILSAATLLLGFFWTLLDEQGLSWHDRISQTYLVDEDELKHARWEIPAGATPGHHAAYNRARTSSVR
jgi:uncharacterized RDD family membrane protein YckC